MTYGIVASTAQGLGSKPDEPIASIAILQAMERLSTFANDTADRLDIKLTPIMFEDIKAQTSVGVSSPPPDPLPPLFSAIAANITTIERALPHINACLSRTAL